MAIDRITPIPRIQQIEQIGPTQGAQPTEGIGSFMDILQHSMGNTNTTDAITQVESGLLSTGDIDDNLALLEINSVKAELALRTFVQVRNKVLEAYQEVMRMNF